MPLRAIQEGPWVLQQGWMKPAVMPLPTGLDPTSQTVHGCWYRRLTVQECQFRLQNLLITAYSLNHLVLSGTSRMLLLGVSVDVTRSCRWL